MWGNHVFRWCLVMGGGEANGGGRCWRGLGAANCRHGLRHTYTHDRQTALCLGLQDYPGRPVPEETFTHSHPSSHPGHQTCFINFLHLLRSTASSLVDLPAWQSFSTTSLQVLFGLSLGRDPLLHTPCISSPNHHLLFATHAHTITACSAVIPMLCHLFLISLSGLI